MGASLALAGLSGVHPAAGREDRAVRQAPEEIVPGKPLFFATAMTLGGYARGVLVESHMGRPTKIEGNPDHPASLGRDATCLRRPSVLALLRPGPLAGGGATRAQFESGCVSQRPWLRCGNPQCWPTGGTAFRILTETVTSPTLADTNPAASIAEMPEAKWHQFDAVARDNVRAGARLAFGEVVKPIYNFDQADVIVSLDADFLNFGPGAVRYARQFAARRGVKPARRDEPAICGGVHARHRPAPWPITVCRSRRRKWRIRAGAGVELGRWGSEAARRKRQRNGLKRCRAIC